MKKPRLALSSIKPPNRSVSTTIYIKKEPGSSPTPSGLPWENGLPRSVSAQVSRLPAPTFKVSAMSTGRRQSFRPRQSVMPRMIGGEAGFAIEGLEEEGDLFD